MTSAYAVSVENIKAKVIPLRALDFDENNGIATIEIDAGMTLQVVERLSAKVCVIRIKDYSNADDRTYESKRFQCHQSALQQVSDDIWPYVIAILDPQERLNFAKQPKKGLRVKQLDKTNIVKVSGRAFGRAADVYDCIIRFIGPVPEIGPGYYFGMELLNLNHGESPQKDDLIFVSKYMSTEPKLALILAANWLELDDSDNKLKHSRKNLIDTIVDGAKDRLGRLHGKRYTELTKSGSDSRDDPITRSFTPDPVGNNRNSADLTPFYEKNQMESRQSKRMAASVSSPNLSKQDSSSSTGSSSRIINSHPIDRMSQERFADSQTEDSYRSGRSSQNSSNNSTLKHSKTRKKSSKQGTILSLDDRDLIIIDNTDIKEATSNESDVIIVDPPAILEKEPPALPERDDLKEVDLKDLLGKNWPSAAGETAAILNSDKKTQTLSAFGTNGTGIGGYSSSSSNSTSSNQFQSKFERNKSPNPLSHLANSKPGELNRRREQKVMMDAATMATPTQGQMLHRRK